MSSPSADGAVERAWRPTWPCPVGALLAQHRRGAGDPTWQSEPGRWWRGVRTPEGTATLSASEPGADGVVRCRAWGDGAEWVLHHAPALLGALDVAPAHLASHPVVDEAVRRAPHWRLSRTDLVLESLVPSTIEQKVTGQEAFAGFRRLVRRFGEPAPGPGEQRDLWVQPDARTVALVPSWEWLALGVDGARSSAVVRAAGVASSLERRAAEGPEALDRALCSVPGIGRWTSAEVRARVLGDPDAVSFGDYHLALDIGHAVRGEGFTDNELEEFLEPWRGQRGRVASLVRRMAGPRPRRGPRMAPRTHLPVRRR